jgi:hypothetical protein
MTIPQNRYPAGSTQYIFFATYGGLGQSITLTGLAVTDIEIYKNGSVTQRASDNGYALLDTDGIDFDGITGIHGFSLDLNDNSDASFYAVGSKYVVIVSTVTVDGQTDSFIADRFEIIAAEHTAGYPVVTIKDGTGTGEIDTSSGGVLVSSIAAGAITAAAIATDAIDADAIADNAINAGAIATGALTAAKFAAGAIDAAALAADAGTEIATAVWASAARTLTALDEDSTTIDLDATIQAANDARFDSLDSAVGAVQTTANAIDAKTTNLPSDPADHSVIIDATNAILAAVAALNNISVADVNAQMVDVLATDTYAEPGAGAPGATISLAAKLGYLYAALRNKSEVTSSLHTVYADDGATPIFKRGVADAAGTFTSDELIAP